MIEWQNIEDGAETWDDLDVELWRPPGLQDIIRDATLAEVDAMIGDYEEAASKGQLDSGGFHTWFRPGEMALGEIWNYSAKTDWDDVDPIIHDALRKHGFVWEMDEDHEFMRYRRIGTPAMPDFERPWHVGFVNDLGRP